MIAVLHGKITMGKLTATERANPILVSSTPNESGNAVKIFPKNINMYVKVTNIIRSNLWI